MARNSIAANLLMLILLGGGIFTAFSMQKEVFPQFQLDVVTVAVAYPGAAPAEVEQGILQPVEEAIRGIEGIRELTSSAREGRGSVNIELVAGSNRMKAFQEIDQAVSRIRTFPDDIEEPEVSLQSRQREVMELGLYGPVDIFALRKLAERLRDRLVSHPAITQVSLGNVPDYQTHVEIPRDRLREYGLTLADVARGLEQSSEDVPAGSLETDAGEILLRVKERRQWAEEYRAIEIVTGKNGSVLTLGDIANVRDGFEEAGFHSMFNEEPSVEIGIYRVGGQSPLYIAEAVEDVLAEVERTLPPGVEWRIDSNNARDYRQRLSLLLGNGWMAILIVLALLALFLELRLAFWVMMGMSLSFVGGIVVLPLFGVSINMISMFGFLVVLGIVVDDAIVVGENIYEHRQQAKSPVQAAIAGVREVAGPVTFSILTNVVAFIPLLFIPGETGKFWWPLPVVVIVILILSLFEALFILPAHLAHSGTSGTIRVGGHLHAVQQGFAKGLQGFVNRSFRVFLNLCLRNRYITIFAANAGIFIVGGFGLSGHMGMILMPRVSADEIEAGVSLPVGTTPNQAARVANEITAATSRMFEEHGLDDVAEGIKTNVRGQSFIDVEIVMKPPDERDMTAVEVIRLWRDEIGEIAGVDQITFEAERGPGGWRQDISVDLSHNDLETLETASEAFLRELETFSNTRDVNDNYNRGKKQLDFRLLPEGRALGFTPAEVGRQLRGAFYGELALRQLRGTNEVEVRVRLPESERTELYHLQNLVLQSPGGTEVPLFDIVEVRRGEAFTTISRRDGQRIVTVSTDVEPKRAVTRVIREIREKVLPRLRERYPGLTWSFQGSQADMRASTQTLWGGFGLAIGVMYALLAVAFRSYVQPLIVLGAVPFGIVGAIIGHLILGYDLSLISLMGVIALSGVVVNGSLILVEFANRRRDERTPHEAVEMASLRRFRPIVMTTITTFGGLLPLIFERSLQAQYIIPMTISLGFGILFASAIILILVPCLYLFFGDINNLLLRRKKRRNPHG